ncbi:MAG: tRNA (guanine-N7-)-methyltransferase [Patiriisocius sp.]|jgi:tRNA (guanine-N7-)-methyltransferase
MTENHRRPIRSFVIREGRMTPGQRRALEEAWPDYGLEVSDGLLDLDSLFSNSAPTICEIGFGMGDSLFEMAEKNARLNYIGVEVHRPGVGHLLKLAEESSLNNLKVFAEDSIDVLTECIPPKSLDGIQIFFPDPWHKKKHHKRRLISESFSELLEGRLKTGGVLHIATDWSHYAESIAETLSSWQKTSIPERVETKYERRGIGLDHEVFDLAYVAR